MVLAAGLWTSELARLAGASVALYPAEHVWVMTEPSEGAREEAPFLRDLDGYLYVRHHRGSYVIGAFEPNGKPMSTERISTTGFVEFGPDWDHFAPVLANARQRIPELETIGFSHYLRAPESFTPDAAFQLGEFPEVPGLWVAAGLNSQGIIYGPGVGMALAEWIVEGHPTYDLADVDVARMGRWANNRRWLHERTVESLGGLYEMHWPGKQPVTARGVRRIPLYERMRAAGAAFGQAAGWERANWFEPGTRRPVGDLRLRASRRGSRRCARRCARPARPSRSTTCRPTRSSSSRGRERSPACNGSARPTSTCPSVASSTPCSATSAAASRWTPP